ncbi:PadR family transcriptional regulator [Mycetocola tolaasinivorans]|uniref:PadR family transcriptional regulator n=1 Tax=Mycetocola tolaasinivorans TaxID=76635 RepID=A0A3L7A735_9MICO|nr:helix-turn-helix transcriptional regulator [Mycetocola tolaasinivorans]RLP75698.1 PadR family transcriptional regulator [Mycetocola tolaasinivorans]
MLPLSRITPATVDVLDALLNESDSVWGLLIVKQTGRPAGSVYPILERLEGAGWVTSGWEEDDARAGARRRLYTLTPEGAAAARTTVADARAKAAAKSARVARTAARAGSTGSVGSAGITGLSGAEATA